MYTLCFDVFVRAKIFDKINISGKKSLIKFFVRWLIQAKEGESRYEFETSGIDF